MAAGYQELFIEQGSDYATSITLDDVNGVGFDLTDYTAKSQIRKSYYSANTTAEFQIVFSDSANGEITIKMSAANTSNLRAGQYFFDVKVNDTTATYPYTRLIEGVIFVTPSVTR